MKILPTLLAGVTLFAAGSVAAQTAPEAPASAPQQTNEAPAEAAPMATATSEAQFTDAQIESFAAAALKIDALKGKETVTQEQLSAIVTESGIDPATYVAIAKAMKSDTAIAQRVQVAASALQNSAAG